MKGRDRRAVMLELNMYRSLYLWTRGSRVGVESGVTPFGYSGVNAVAVWAFIGVAAVELPFFHFLIPWEWARITFIILGVWTLIWMLGYAGSLRVYPHLVGPDGLRIRQGARVDVFVSWGNVESIRTRTRNYVDGAKVQIERSEGGDVFALTTSNQTNVEVVLREPITIPIRQAAGAHVHELRCIADDPAGLCSAARGHLLEGAR